MPPPRAPASLHIHGKHISGLLETLLAGTPNAGPSLSALKMATTRTDFTLPASKTDPFRQGVATSTTAVDGHACAALVLHLLFAGWSPPPKTP